MKKVISVSFLLGTILFALLAMGTPLFGGHNCDFAAVLSKSGITIPSIPNGQLSFDDPEDYFFDFVTIRSSYEDGSNDNGYGVVYGLNGSMQISSTQQDLYFSTVPYFGVPDDLTNPEFPYDQGPMNLARADILNPSSNVVMVMSHSRNASDDSAVGNHPFLFNWNGRTYAFMHNGVISASIRAALWNELYNNAYPTSTPGRWFQLNPSNYLPFDQCGSYANFIDSELLFHWIMKNIKDHHGSVHGGMYAALTATVYMASDPPVAVNLADEFNILTHWSPAGRNKINFVLSDGEGLYAFRNTPTTWDTTYTTPPYDNVYKLSFKEHNDFYGIKTQGYEDGTAFAQFDFYYFSRGSNPVRVRNFLNANFTDFKIQMKDDPSPVNDGEALTYHIAITNCGNIAAAATLTDDLSDHLDRPTYSFDGVFWGNWTGSIALPSIAPGSTVTVYIKAEVRPREPVDYIKNTATVSLIPDSFRNFDPYLKNNTAQIATEIDDSSTGISVFTLR